MAIFQEKSLWTIVIVLGLLLAGSRARAGNLPVWGGATTTDQTLIQQPSKPLVSEPVVNTAPTVQPTQPSPWRSPGTTVTPTVSTPTQQFRKQPTEPAGTKTQWSQWSELAWAATKNAVNTQWKLQVFFQNVTINGPTAVGTPGCLKGPDLGPLIRSYMLTNGAPEKVADIFANSVAGAWKAWQDSVMIPGLPWYPAFAAYPGPQAPPMPNVATPLIALVASRQVELTSVERLAARIFEQFRGTTVSPEARDAIQHFSQLFSTRFLNWIVSAQVMNVMGQGPVPSFAPPVVPTGPVVAGSVIPAPGVVLGSQL